MIQRARKLGGQAQVDLETMVDIKIRRMLLIGEMSGLWALGLVSFAFTAMALLSVVYSVEFAQALFLLLFPLVFVGAMALSTAVKIRDRGLEGEGLHRALMRQRFSTQVIGIVSIFITAMWGMYQNLQLAVL